MLVQDLVREISVDLNDQEPGYEFSRWPAWQLQTYVREALIEISRQVKEWFTKQQIVKLSPGVDWQEICGVTEILRVRGESDAEGRVLRPIRRVEDIESNTWTVDNSSCVCPVTPEEYIVSDYSISALQPNSLRVTPAVPAGVEKYVLVEGFTQPTGAMNEDVVPQTEVMVKHWAIYRALSIDSENNQAIASLAKNHVDVYFSLLKDAVENKVFTEKRGDHLRAFSSNSAKQVPGRDPLRV